MPSSVRTGAVAFTAPANTLLAANTRYYLVVYTFHFSLSKLKVAITNDSDEDSGAATGWSIANHGYYLQLQSPYQRQNSPQPAELDDRHLEEGRSASTALRYSRRPS